MKKQAVASVVRVFAEHQRLLAGHDVGCRISVLDDDDPRVGHILKKPMVSGLDLPGTKKLTLNHVLSDKVDDVPSGKKLEATKSFKAAVRMLAGDNRPTKGSLLRPLRVHDYLPVSTQSLDPLERTEQATCGRDVQHLGVRTNQSVGQEGHSSDQALNFFRSQVRQPASFLGYIDLKGRPGHIQHVLGQWIVALGPQPSQYIG